MSGKVARLNKSLYGLKQASRTFYKRLVSDLKRIGFEQSMSDPCVLRFMMGDEVVGMVAIHVDDILYAGTKSLAEVVVEALGDSLPTKNLGVSFVFFLVGLTIKLGQLAGAALNVRLNVLTQAFSLGVLPAVGLGLATVLAAGGMHPALADGVLILMALPTTVNMCVILTQSAEGNTAAAAFNAVLGNLLGVVVTPALLLLLIGRRLDMTPSLVAAFRKLGIKVVLPLALGQLARFTPLRMLHERKPKVVSRMSECVLLSIIYTTFCDTFSSRAGED
eukprot:jgi/Undpi1/9110/HiC_scaffold_26.g11568.m1